MVEERGITHKQSEQLDSSKQHVSSVCIHLSFVLYLDCKITQIWPDHSPLRGGQIIAERHWGSVCQRPVLREGSWVKLAYGSRVTSARAGDVWVKAGQSCKKFLWNSDCWKVCGSVFCLSPHTGALAQNNTQQNKINLSIHTVQSSWVSSHNPLVLGGVLWLTYPYSYVN